MSRRLRRYLKVVLPLVFFVLFAAGCANDGFPQSYDDQIDPETQLSNVETNWMSGCEVGFSQQLAQSANAVCRCSYARIKAEIPFEAFVEANDKLKNNPESLATTNNPGSTETTIVEIVKDCIATT